ncbi:type 4 pilus major pilin [Paraburkholderia megapolitana]|uniref:PilS N terminal n=1 Tax=Paraburkholderia megapolitana TaxID=420953 RepID=A0A1I3DV44_9BURK|nr:type 4 pilus major pilin [Paraburkholderia megapolitana]SFH90606.1 PilS N terminal [Paraburkholderia megapolitana]
MQQTMKLASRLGIRAARVSRQGQRGASLLEAIAYLGIAAIVVIGAVALLNGAFTSAGSNAVAEQVNAIQTGVKKLYMTQGAGYTGVSNAILSQAGVFPGDLAVTAGTGAATDSWGGAVTVAVSGTSPSQFTIAFANVPKAVCISAVTAGGSWAAIGTNTTASILPLPPSLTDAETACPGDGNTITWTSN